MAQPKQRSRRRSPAPVHRSGSANLVTATLITATLVMAAILAACGSDGASTADQAGGSATPSTSDQPTADEPTADNRSADRTGAGELVVGRPDITPEGNRVAEGRGALGQVTPIDVDLPATPTWVLPVSDPAGESEWYVTLSDGTAVLVDQAGLPTPAATDLFPKPDLQPFTDPLPDGRSVGDGSHHVALVEPTDRYAHGVLGDRIEAAAIEVIDLADNTSIRFGPAAPTVIEGISPLLADIDLDGQVDILVTHSNADVGAWLAVWSLDGMLIAESAPIGQGNRWRNQLAVAPTGPNREVEIIDVRTPHLGKTVEYLRFDGGRLDLVADLQGFTSHTIGSRNLDLGIVADGNGDEVLDVILPTGDLSKLGVLTRVDGGVEVVALLDLPGRLTTNVAAGSHGRQDLGFAVGTDRDVLRIWPGS